MEKVPAQFKGSTSKLDELIKLQTLFSKRVKIGAIDKVLYSVYRGYSSPSEIMDRLNISKGNLANYCKIMIENGRLTRVEHHKIRGVRYALTPKGKEKVEKLLTIIDQRIISIKEEDEEE